MKLQEIKERFDNNAYIEDFGDYEIASIDKKDLVWLIEQTEKLKDRCKSYEDKINRYEMMYDNTGAMFNRMTMKEKIERYEKALNECIRQDGLLDFLDKNDWACQEDYFVEIGKKSLGK